MKEDVLVSVIVPVYNVEAYLNQCLESIVGQTHSNLEIILVDDGSPDACPKLCDMWMEKDNRVKVIHKKNAGLGMARNSGLEIATGDYVVFTDSDDYISLNMVEKLLECTRSEKVDSAYCGISRFTNEGKIVKVPSVYSDETFEGEEVAKKVLFRMLGNLPENDNGHIMYMSVCLALYNRSIIEKYQIRFPSERIFLSEDLSFNIDYLMHCNRVRCIGESLYFYRHNNNSLTTKKDDMRYQKIKNLHLQVLEKLEGYFPNKEYEIYERCRFLSVIRGQIVNVVRDNSGKKVSRIRKITNDPLVMEEIAQYQYNKNPKGRRIFNTLLAHRMNILLLVFVKGHLLLKSV